MLAVTPAGTGYVRGSARAALYASIVGPLFLTGLLLFVSGLPLQERPGAKKRYEKGIKWDEYATYLHRTSILFPFPPALYAKMPKFLKRTLFLEFPMYVFDPAKHADQDAVAEREAEEGPEEHGHERESESGHGGHGEGDRAGKDYAAQHS